MDGRVDPVDFQRSPFEIRDQSRERVIVSPTTLAGRISRNDRGRILGDGKRARASAHRMQGSGNLTHRKLIAELAVKHHLPTMFGRSEFVDDGGLMSYGMYIPDLFHRAATYVDKILKGTKPGDLPTQIELVISLTTARLIGVTISPNLLARAVWVGRGRVKVVGLPRTSVRRRTAS